MGSSPSSRPPRPSRPPGPKRPWYLVVALVVGWLMGAGGLVDGCQYIAIYKADAIDTSTQVEAIQDESSRAQLKARFEHLLQVLDDARNRVFPLSVAALLLGAAMVALSARAMGGRGGARHALMQVVTAYAGLTILTYALTRDVRRAEYELKMLDYGLEYSAVVRYAPAIAVTLRVLACALIVLALSRQRTRAFFDATQGSLSER